MTDDLSIPSFLDRTGDTPSEEQHADHDARRASWRDYIKIHPAAELFPLMSEPELRELGEDIKANGLLSPIILTRVDDCLELLDGRNRLDAMEMVGKEFDFEIKLKLYAVHEIKIVTDDPYEYVIGANIHRRHLTDEQRRELIAKLIKAKPEESDRAIAKKVKRDHKTVAKVRKKMESTGEVSPVEKRTGADGKKRKKPAKKKPAPDSSLDKLFEGAAPGRVTESAEVSIEERRAQNAALDEPAEVDEVKKRVDCLTNTIVRHVEGLTRADTERFFTALRLRLDAIEAATNTGAADM